MRIKVLQIGAGSMGTRRIRDLTARADVEVALLEMRADRRDSASNQFGIPCFDNMESALAWGAVAISISTPPQSHSQYVEIALDRGLHFFCEAELFPFHYREVELATAEKSTVAAPSCTLQFLPIYKELSRIVREELGVLHAYTFILSIDMASWHPDEGTEYYARNRSTNGTREMVAFELIGLANLFSEPQDVTGIVRTGGELEPNYEDSWSLQMRLDNGGIGQLVVLGASPQVIRKGVAVGTHGTIEFDLLSGDIHRSLPLLGIHDTRNYGQLSQLLESVYKEEIDAFVETIKGSNQWPYDFRTSNVICGTLAAAEKSAITGKVEKVNPNFLPAELPDQYEDDNERRNVCG
ncbi:Gfo/Idh/MocA family protein [Paenibacillus nasutitermitis]|uniref:Gfo/Idh/MocA-like oxidoreductase N-terminal domain-containing protein n=1 Tax=Paenibacillus nasutitermitis TaxID=1652958 RepID=A0A916YRE4_9BACL|nr:Gfo/Idh/MocA family oxidoreductase [Paenibacillus nasutitermitis]GGD56511.1 hypothetical protein GCM10010911_12780 [Paenibacillus nasutitermitis]